MNQILRELQNSLSVYLSFGRNILDAVTPQKLGRFALKFYGTVLTHRYVTLWSLAHVALASIPDGHPNSFATFGDFHETEQVPGIFKFNVH